MGELVYNTEVTLEVPERMIKGREGDTKGGGSEV